MLAGMYVYGGEWRHGEKSGLSHRRLWPPKEGSVIKLSALSHTRLKSHIGSAMYVTSEKSQPL